MSKVLVISGHPSLEQSNANAVVIEQAKAQITDIEVRRLDTLYPDFNIDIAAEQAALIEAKVIVLQFPFHWYSMPALLKQWLDQVFSYNFAYGAQGDKLKSKHFILSFTVGGPADSYDPLGYNHFTIPQLLHPIQQTAYLAGMIYHPPVYSHGMVYIPNVYNTLEDVQQRATEHSTRLITQINDIVERDETYIDELIREWFLQFDRLEGDSEFFTQYLAKDVVWNMPEGEFAGHEGFRDWYAIACKQFKPNCDHHVEQRVITPTESGYQIDLRIRLTVETYPESDFKGESLNLLVNEVWQVTVDANKHVTIHSYIANPIG